MCSWKATWVYWKPLNQAKAKYTNTAFKWQLTCRHNQICNKFRWMSNTFEIISIPWNFWVFFVCLYGVYLHTREFFTHMETSQLPLKGCKFWPMLGMEQWEFFSCDTGHPFIMVISEDQWHSHLLPRVKQWRCHNMYLVYDLGVSRLGFKHPAFRLRG